MPLVLRQAITSGIVLGIWKIDERPEELLALCPENDRRESEQFTNPSRQREWLAWHALLQQLHPGAKAEYDAQGGPTLDINRHIGVSHTRGYAAVILAPTPCAIDIENVDRDFSRVRNRFLTGYADRGHRSRPSNPANPHAGDHLPVTLPATRHALLRLCLGVAKAIVYGPI